MNELIENAVFFDSQLSEYGKGAKSKSQNTLDLLGNSRKSIFRIFFYGRSFSYGFLHLHCSKKDHFYPLEGIFMGKIGWGR